MGLTFKTAFTAGELDPTLWERTTLDKYRTGCAAARNVIVSKTGSVLSRHGRSHIAQTKFANRVAILYSPPGSGLVLELGHLYLRVYPVGSQVLILDIPQTLQESDLMNVHFETGGSYVYIFCAGKEIQKFNYALGSFVASASIFPIPAPPIFVSVVATGTPSGYGVDYAFSYVLNGVESFFSSYGSVPVPIDVGQSNLVTAIIVLGSTVVTGITEMRVYRRPTNSGDFGYIGSSSYFFVNAGNLLSQFTDIGQDADYTHSPPVVITPEFESPINMNSNTGLIYQQRLLLTDTVFDLEAIYASRPGHPENFTQDYPIAADSALQFKAGTSGYARVYRMIDSDGLVVFTAAGIYLNQGPLEPDNLALAKKGKWIIYPYVPPLAVPGGVLFIDGATNAVRNLQWSLQVNAFDAEEVSIYSAHLFKTRTVNAWNFQEGQFPLLWVVFNDGTFASFTFEFDQQMRAWTRHDSALPVASSCGTTFGDTAYFISAKVMPNGDVLRFIEMSNPRYVPPSYLATDPDADKNPSCAYMDGITSFSTVLNNLLNAGDSFQFSPTVEDDWTQPLNLTCTTGIFYNPGTDQVPHWGEVGSVYRFFDEDKTAIDVKVTQWISNFAVIVEVLNVDTFPQEWATGAARLYFTYTTFSNLSYLEGEYPAIIVDGAVVCSPNNDVDNYPVVQVINGTVTLPNGIRGAITHIGRPIVGDLETLDIDTVEQAPTLIESLNVNKLYIKVHNSVGLYVGNKFPEGNSVQGMAELDSYDVDYSADNPIIGNRAPQPQTKRVELILPGDWKSQGKICIRQVDPLHFEILSIIPDCEILNRSDR